MIIAINFCICEFLYLLISVNLLYHAVSVGHKGVMAVDPQC